MYIGSRCNKASVLKTIILSIMVMFVLLTFSACISNTEKLELTNYTGQSVKNFEKKTGARLIEENNGVYSIKDSLQFMAHEGKINAITLLENSGNYTLLGIKTGMSKTEAEKKLTALYGEAVSRTINSDNKSCTYSYSGKDSVVYVSYDIDTETVVGVSYYVETSSEESREDEAPAGGGELVMIVGNKRVYYNEVMVYLKSVQETYESDYGEDIWGIDIFGNGVSFGEQIKEEVLKQITELKIINEEAKKLGITLNEDEEAEAISYADEHYKGLKNEDIDRYLITPELLQRVYEDNMLAEKAFETLTINVDTEVSDIDAKQITVQHILIYGVDFDEEGNRIPLSAEEKEEAYEKALNILQEARTTDDFYSLAQGNTQADTIEYTFGRGQGPSEYSKAFEQAAFTLKTGDVSNIITTDYGWHIIYCVTDNNKDATIQAKEKIIEGRRTEMFSKLYSEWSKEYDVIINTEVWDTVSF